MIFAVDFDGTLSKFKYPNIGEPVPYAIESCLSLQDEGHKLILYTMRDGDELQAAVDWCKERGLVFWGVNKNPTQHNWTKSPKIDADLYIDDKAYGVPLILTGGKPMVDWSKVLDYVRNFKKSKKST